MQKLPYLVLNKIINYLSIDEKLKLKLVSKNLNVKINKLLNLDTLFLYNEVYPINTRWSFTNKLVGYNNSFKIDSFKFLESKLTRNYFKNIRKLFIYSNCLSMYKDNDSNEFYVERNLNNFQNLEQLELKSCYCTEFIDNNREYILNLPQLKYLIITASNELNLITPKLEVLISNGLDAINILNSNNLKYLQCDGLPDNIREFTKLEILIVNNINSFDKKNLDYLTNLKELQIYSEYYDDTNFILNELNLKKKQLKRNYPRIYNCGFENLEINSTNDDQCSYFSGDTFFLIDHENVKTIKNYYSKLPQSINIDFQIDFNCLIKTFNKLPNDFHQRFPKITRCILKNYTDDLNYFLKFFYDCGTINRLTIEQNEFTQQFANQLSECITIESLKIISNYWRINDLNFLISIKCLQNLNLTIPSISIDLINSLFEKCVGLVRFCYLNKESNIRIYLKNNLIKNLFELEINKRQYECKSIDEALRMLRKRKDIKKILY